MRSAQKAKCIGGVELLQEVEDRKLTVKCLYGATRQPSVNTYTGASQRL